MKHILLASIIGLFAAGIFLSSNSQAALPCANTISCVKDLTSKTEPASTGVFMGQVIAVPSSLLAKDISTKVLGTETASDAGSKHIYVDLASQTLYAFDGDKLFFETLVSTGKWGRTPTGEFRIWVKLRSTRMSGGSGNDAYDLPNVPYVLFFYNKDVSKDRGYSLHGAYWHNNFGHEMSHGCVNMRPTDAKVIYDWASPTTKEATTYESAQDPGTTVTICSKIDMPKGSKPVCYE